MQAREKNKARPLVSPLYEGILRGRPFLRFIENLVDFSVKPQNANMPIHYLPLSNDRDERSGWAFLRFYLL